MSVETIARRYAAALADVAVQKGQTEAVAAELASWGSLVAGNAELHSMFANPAIAHSGKEKVLEELIRRSNVSPTTANFLRVLLKNDRIADIAAINERFVLEIAERGGQIGADVTSARELPEAEREAFRSQLSALTGKNVNVNFLIDPQLIGGAVARIGSTVYDGSVKTKLENLKERLVNG